MACRPPMRPKSTPYWKGERIMIPQATKTFQWASHPSPFCFVVMVGSDESGNSVSVATSWRRARSNLPLDARPRGYLRVSRSVLSLSWKNPGPQIKGAGTAARTQPSLVRISSLLLWE